MKSKPPGELSVRAMVTAIKLRQRKKHGRRAISDQLYFVPRFEFFKKSFLSFNLWYYRLSVPLVQIMERTFCISIVQYSMSRD